MTHLTTTNIDELAFLTADQIQERLRHDRRRYATLSYRALVAMGKPVAAGNIMDAARVAVFNSAYWAACAAAAAREE